jgi:hypothetical protein
MRRPWLVSYDIACPKRWRRVFARRMLDATAYRLLILPLDPTVAPALPGGPRVGIV